MRNGSGLGIRQTSDRLESGLRRTGLWLGALVLAVSVFGALPVRAAVLQIYDPGGMPGDVIPNDETTFMVPGSFFDLTATSTVPITAFAAFSDAAKAGAAGDPYTIEIWTKIGTYVGSETMAGDWTLLQTFSGTDPDEDTPELLTLSVPLVLTAGQTRGFAVFGTVGGLRWFDSCGGTSSYTDGTLTLNIFPNRGADDGFNAVDQCRSFAGQVIYSTVRKGCQTN